MARGYEFIGYRRRWRGVINLVEMGGDGEGYEFSGDRMK